MSYLRNQVLMKEQLSKVMQYSSNSRLYSIAAQKSDTEAPQADQINLKL
jgi:hypothetical protein